MDITVDVRGEVWPPKLRGNKLMSLEYTRVASSGVVMVAGDNRMAEVGISRDIDTSLVGQNPGIVMPIRETGAEFSGDLTWESMESIKNE